MTERKSIASLNRCLQYFIIIVLLPVPFAFAQVTDISGKVRTSSDFPMEGVHVRLMETSDTMKSQMVATDNKGAFRFQYIRRGSYRLEVTAVGYRKIQRFVHADQALMDLGKLVLEEEPIQMDDIVIQGRVAPAVQKGDTTEYNAKAYKTHPDATADELLAKMPGVTVDNSGTVKAGGETVEKILVNGKQYFGNDPAIAIKNLPADMIDKIQVFDQLSEQSQFTGFDDGSRVKTINITTRDYLTHMHFGRFYGGYGESDRYSAGGNYNDFSPDQRFSLLGSSNNVNQQNFGTQDFLGAMSGGGPGGGGGMGPGASQNGSSGNTSQSQGEKTVSVLGVNYGDSITHSSSFDASYFFNRMDPRTDQVLDRQYITGGDTGTLYHQQTNSDGKNINQRMNGRFDAKIDTSNSITIMPNISVQENRTSATTTAASSLAGILLSRTSTNSVTTMSGSQISGNALFRHKFDTPGRTFSIGLSFSGNSKESDNELTTSSSTAAAGTDSTVMQKTKGNSKELSLSTDLAYTEPLGKRSMLMLSYSPSFSRSTSDKRTYDYDTAAEQYSVLDTGLSNTYESRYIASKFSAGYRYFSKTVHGGIGIGVQEANLHGSQTYPSECTVDKSFLSILPDAMLGIKFAGHQHLEIRYRASTQAPSVSQLQNVVDNSNTLILSTGNADLRQSYSHTLDARYAFTDVENANSLFLSFSATCTNGYIGTSTYAASSDTAIRGVSLVRGTELTLPDNYDGYLKTSSFVSYGLPVDFLSSTLNLNTGFDYSRTPGSTNGIVNYANTYGITQSAVVASNVSTDLDFTISYSGSYNITENTLASASRTHYYSHSLGVKLNLIFLNGCVFRNDVSQSLTSGLGSGYDQNSIIWNMAVARKFLGRNRGEIRLSVNDLLGQQKSIDRTVASAYVQDTRTDLLTRYVMLTASYVVR
jgi:hypothetical protein